MHPLVLCLDHTAIGFYCFTEPCPPPLGEGRRTLVASELKPQDRTLGQRWETGGMLMAVLQHHSVVEIFSLSQ